MQHAMGGLHEQQRDRRKHFIKINWANIEASDTDQFALNQHTINNEPYDYKSVLQYHLQVGRLILMSAFRKIYGRYNNLI
jgi:hypothetical protein